MDSFARDKELDKDNPKFLASSSDLVTFLLNVPFHFPVTLGQLFPSTEGQMLVGEGHSGPSLQCRGHAITYLVSRERVQTWCKGIPHFMRKKVFHTRNFH